MPNNDSPNLDLSKGWWLAHAVVNPDGKLIIDTVSPTRGACKARTERLLQAVLPPNWTLEEVVIVRRKPAVAE